MQNIKILNSKEIKKVIELVSDQWECDIELDYVFLQNNKDRIFIVNKEISGLDLSKLRINSLGLYFGEINMTELRLSIEGSQIVGPHAKKNVLELSDEEARKWMKGEDLEKEIDAKGFLIIKHGDDYLGCGKAKDKKIFNYVSKVRRLNCF